MNYSLHHPLYHTGSSLPPHLLLMAKLLWIGLLGKGYFSVLLQPFLPFIPVFDYIPGPIFQWTLRTLFIIGGMLLLFNLKPRLACALLALVFLSHILSSKNLYSNGKFFVGMLFLLISISDKDKRPWLIQWQIILMYFGSGLNKILDPDWRSGIYFDYWMNHILHSELYLFIARSFGEMLTAKFMCWGTIFTELLILPIFFTFKKFHAWGIWVGIIFHSLAFWLSGMSFGIFFAAVLIGYLAFADYPHHLNLKIPDTSFWTWTTTRLIKPTDFDQRFNLLKHASPPVSSLGAEVTVNLQSGNLLRKCLNLRQILINYPLIYYVIGIFLTANYLPNFTQHLGTLAVIILFFPWNTIMKRITY